MRWAVAATRLGSGMPELCMRVTDPGKTAVHRCRWPHPASGERQRARYCREIARLELSDDSNAHVQWRSLRELVGAMSDVSKPALCAQAGVDKSLALV